jgi:hypothetical protein
MKSMKLNEICLLGKLKCRRKQKKVGLNLQCYSGRFKFEKFNIGEREILYWRQNENKQAFDLDRVARVEITKLKHSQQNELHFISFILTKFKPKLKPRNFLILTKFKAN